MIRRIIIGVAATVVLVELALLFSGYRVLVSERMVRPGQQYVAGEWSDLANNRQASLVCHYFTGRSVTMTVLWYSPHNVFGRDSCPFLTRAD